MKEQGFKAFNKNMTNQYGLQFKEGKIYQIPDNIVLTKGIMGTGFHYTPYLEDTLRYVNGMIEEIKIARVTAGKEIITFDDEYNGYYDISATREITINHILTRQEILNHMLKQNDYSVIRFVQGYKLTAEEIDKIIKKFRYNPSLSLAIDYYQNGNRDAYNEFYKVKKSK